jgi:hypothetical protein
VVGDVETYAIDLTATMRSDLFLRILVPADAETAAKFERLARIGSRKSSLKFPASAV